MENENLGGLKRAQRRENQKNLLREKNRGIEREKMKGERKERETMKLKTKGHVSRHVGRQLHQLCVHDALGCSTCDPTLSEWRPKIALGVRVGDSADLASASRDQMLGQLDATIEENVDVDTLSNVKENVDTPVENYWCETTQGLEVLQTEPDMPIAPNDDDDIALEIGVISERPEDPQIENKEDQPLVLVKPPTLPCIFVKPYTGVEAKERLQIFYTADTFVLDDHDMTDSFVLEVPNELPILKEGVHDALPKYVDAQFVVDISKGEGIT
ncbi:hypothetical protein Syun_021978 [Stephania yunnanensis]|uniref:Uncharacterized protein n=1 Tax=Stephania yunnanensis TaxID=152371 RepID=A0AAP0NSR5_9MAGN